MIIKSVTHTSDKTSIYNLIDYVFRDKDTVNRKGESVIISKLLHSERSNWPEQFLRIENRRTSFYAGREVKYYHEILSFSPESKPSKKELEDLIENYLELRLDTPTLAFASVHFSDSHYHAHIIIQGVNCYGKSIRKSKEVFRDQVQVALNRYQEKTYPHLSASIIDYTKASQNRIKLESDKAWQRKKRTGKRTHKEELEQVLKPVYINANSIEAFIAELAIQNIDVTHRRGKLSCVVYKGREYRIRKTLGIDFEKLLKPNLKKERMERLRQIAEEQKQNRKNKER
jgi:hypothetical protein